MFPKNIINKDSQDDVLEKQRRRQVNTNKAVYPR